MIVFVTVFLALTMGVQSVEVAVEGPIAQVEFILDGQVFATRTEAPWQASCNFGDGLEPHELIAIARDREGNELGRARQLVNSPRARAETNLVLQRGNDGAPKSVRVLATNATNDRMENIRVTLDGAELDVSADGLAVFPEKLPAHAHVLSAVVTFEGGLVSRNELAFGSTYGSETETELTAVPVISQSNRRRLQVDDLKDVFQANEETLSVAAVEKMGIRVLVIIAEEAMPVLHRFARLRGFRPKSLRRYVLSHTDFESDQLIFVQPFPTVKQTANDHPLKIFPTVVPVDLSRRKLHDYLEAYQRDGDEPDQRISDAVATAGFASARTACPRAVLLLLGDTLHDADSTPPAVVRGYLKSINVPLYVWQLPRSKVEKTRQELQRGENRPPQVPIEAWQPDHTIESHRQLVRASKDLVKQVRSQRIAWIEGARLPNTISLAEGTTNVEIAR